MKRRQRQERLQKTEHKDETRTDRIRKGMKIVKQGTEEKLKSESPGQNILKGLNTDLQEIRPRTMT